MYVNPFPSCLTLYVLPICRFPLDLFVCVYIVCLAYRSFALSKVVAMYTLQNAGLNLCGNILLLLFVCFVCCVLHLRALLVCMYIYAVCLSFCLCMHILCCVFPLFTLSVCCFILYPFHAFTAFLLALLFIRPKHTLCLKFALSRSYYCVIPAMTMPRYPIFNARLCGLNIVDFASVRCECVCVCPGARLKSVRTSRPSVVCGDSTRVKAKSVPEVHTLPLDCPCGDSTRVPFASRFIDDSWSISMSLHNNPIQHTVYQRITKPFYPLQKSLEIGQKKGQKTCVSR